MTVTKEEMFLDPSKYINELTGNKELWEEYQAWSKKTREEFEKRQARPWDLINPNVEKSSEEDAEARYAICKECPSFIKLTKQCKECGCFMKAKVKIKISTCPLGKW